MLYCGATTDVRRAWSSNQGQLTPAAHPACIPPSSEPLRRGRPRTEREHTPRRAPCLRRHPTRSCYTAPRRPVHTIAAHSILPRATLEVGCCRRRAVLQHTDTRTFCFSPVPFSKTVDAYGTVDGVSTGAQRIRDGRLRLGRDKKPYMVCASASCLRGRRLSVCIL